MIADFLTKSNLWFELIFLISLKLNALSMYIVASSVIFFKKNESTLYNGIRCYGLFTKQIFKNHHWISFMWEEQAFKWYSIVGWWIIVSFLIILFSYLQWIDFQRSAIEIMQQSLQRTVHPTD